MKDEILLQLVLKERKLMPKLGTRKLLVRLEPRVPEDLLPGRDKFFDFTRINQLWVSDITYIETAQGFVYIN